jgi:ABC-2 type transport system ATP-binding protein
METVIETRSLSRWFKNKEAVRDLNLRLAPNRVYAFLGRNGAGKTTTIKMLAGIIRPSSGSSALFGQDSQKLRPVDWQKIGYVSENQELYEWMTVEELIAFTAKLYPGWDREFERYLIAKLELPMTRRISKCSRGEKVKLALLLAMAFRPKLILLDEPFAGLDPLARSEFLDTLLEVTAQSDWSVFFSTHDIEDVEKLADEVVILDGGQLQICESLDSLQERFRRVDVIGAHAHIEVDENMFSIQREGERSRFVYAAFSAESEAGLQARFPGAEVVFSPMSLKEIFLTLAKKFQREGTVA